MKTIKTLVGSLLFLAFSSPGFTQGELATTSEIRAALENGTTTSELLVNRYTQQIQQLNDRLHAVTQLNPAAMQEAQRLDKMRREGQVLGPLHGIPVLLKDNIDTADGLPNTAGSILLQDNLPQSDAFLVGQLKKHGAIILGKANLSEWANFRSTHSSSGWSGTGGQARNPYDLTRSPCGSSAGSAIAVAAGMIPLAVGTETDGSITCPAAVNGIVGIKPTLGLISRTGIIPISQYQDTAGPMATTVTGAALMLDAMVGKDTADSDSIAPSGSYADHLKGDGLKGKRIGVVRNLMGYNPQTDAVFEQALAILREQGATIVDNANIETLAKINALEFDLLAWEFKDALNEYLENSPSQYKSLQALITANRESRDKEMPYFGQEIFEMAQDSQGRAEEGFSSKLAELRSLAREQGIDATMAKHKVDILIAPTVSPAWKIDHINGDHYTGSATTPAAVAGYPHITVPMGFVRPLPVGISFFASASQEDRLIAAAYNYEQASKQHRAPRFLNGDPAPYVSGTN
ncbi:amidase [uncultured Microbulbifer sp.]|uniref:amidase n=1 Tax=uncultured Microbulbifer sp. TaxID=348147 RepID=UPI0025DF4009|nr:amidase [uncultured Microbulbifer sp.]